LPFDFDCHKGGAFTPASPRQSRFFNSERAGSHINRVKALERIGLQRGAFSFLVFGAFNNAHVKELDTQRPVSKWKSDGHMSGTTAGWTEEDQSKVLKRHLETKSPRFLLSKEAAHADYIRRNERALDN
jgi:hypothetical protein